MEKDLVQVVIDVLITFITGGFIIVLLEIKNRKNRVRDDFMSIKRTFLDKLTAYCRFVVWFEPTLYYYDGAAEYLKKFKESVEYVKLTGERVIASHTSLISMNESKEFMLLFSHISNIWSEYGNKSVPYMSRNLSVFERNRRFIEKEVAKFAPDYLSHIDELSSLADVSGDFYNEICEPFLEKLDEHRLVDSLYEHQSRLVFGMILLVVVAIIILVCLSSVCWLPYCFLGLVLLLFVASLTLLCVDANKQLRFRYRLKEFKQKVCKMCRNQEVSTIYYHKMYL